MKRPKGLWNTGVIVTLGDGTDGDTCESLFGYIARQNYVVAINGEDVELISASDWSRFYQCNVIRARKWSDEEGRSVGAVQIIPWSRVRTFHVY